MWPGIAEFKFDEATVARSAILFTRQADIPSGFPSSIAGVSQPPFMAFLLSPPFALSRNPALAVFYLGLLSTVTVYLTYLLGRQLFDFRVGLVAAAFFAMAPWVIFYTRKLWAQNVPLFTVIMMLSLLAVVRSGRVRFVLVTIASLGLLIGLYLGNIVLAAVIALILILHLPRILPGRPRELALWVLIALMASSIFLVPYLLESVPAILERVASQGAAESGQFLFFRRLTELTRAATGYQFHALVGEQFPEYYEFLPLGDLSALDLVATWLIRFAAFYVLVRAIYTSIETRQMQTAYVVLAIWIFVPLLSWSMSGLDPQPHRYIMVYPAQHLALAVLFIDGIDYVSEVQPNWRRFLYGVLVTWVMVLGAWHVTEYIGMMRFIDRGLATVGGFDVPAREVWATAQEARQLAELQDLPVVVYSDGDDPLTEGDAAVWASVLGDQALHLVDGERMTVMPASGDYVRIVENDDLTYSVDKLESEPVDTDNPVVRFVNGIDLIAIEVPAGDIVPGERLNLDLTWQVWGIPPTDESYSYTVQLFTDDGVRWAQFDRQFLRTEYWQPSDVIVTDVPLDVSPDAPAIGDSNDEGRFYQLVIAMYVFTPGEIGPGVDVRDADGNIIGTFLIEPYAQFR